MIVSTENPINIKKKKKIHEQSNLLELISEFCKTTDYKMILKTQ